MEEYMSLTHYSTGQYSLTYDKYFMMLQDACIRYDKTLKQKPSTTSRAVCQYELDDDPSVHGEEDDYLDETFAPVGIDTSSDDIYNIHNTNFKRSPQVNSLFPGTSKPNNTIPPKPRYNGPIYLPKHIYNMFSEDIKEIDKYNQKRRLNTSLHIPGWPRFMSKTMKRLTILTILSLTWRTISMKTHILCKIQILKIFWKHMSNTQQTWHPYLISLNTLLPLIDL